VKPVKLSSEASQELIGIAEFYDQRRIGLGAAFAKEVWSLSRDTRILAGRWEKIIDAY